MKVLWLAVMLVGSAALPAQAETMWVGNAAVTAATTACGTAAAAGDFARMTYRPAAPGLDNGADSYLAYVPTRSSYAMTVPNNVFRSGVNYSGQSVGSTIGVATKSGGITAWDQSPVTPATTTHSINVTSTFANFWAITGCTVSIRVNLLRVKSGPGDMVN